MTFSAVSEWEPTAQLLPESASWSTALNKASGFTIRLPFEPDLEALFRQSGSGVRIVDNGVPFLGIARQVERQGNRALTVSGVSALSMLADRTPIPEPANVAGPWTTNEFHTVTAAPVAAWVSLLGAHIAAVNVRRLPQGCRVEGVGTVAGSVTLSARWSPDLLAVVEELATGTGVSITADVARVDNSTELVFTVSALGSAPATVFDPALGSVSDFRSLSRTEWPTHVYVGGAGEGTARLVRVRSIEGPRRIERWIEASSDVAAELDTIGDAFLASGRSPLTLEVEIDDSDLRYGSDYRVGDLVTVRVAGVGQSVDRVTAVESSLSASGVSRKVRVGSGSLSLLSDGSSARIGRLEGA